MSSNRFRSALLLLALAGLGVCGCNAPTKTNKEPPPPQLDLSSPAATLAELRAAYVARDSVKYAKLFEDDFVFHFSPADLIGDSPLPFATWPLSDERHSASHMFGDSLVDKIALTFSVGDTIPAGDVVPGSYEVVVDQVHLSVFVTRDGVPWELRVNNSDAKFYFRRSVGEDGRQIWRIVRWDDQPIGLLTARPLVMENTWGKIKALYH